MTTLDFDGTIYNITALKKEFRQIFNLYGLEFDTVYRRSTKHAPFRLECLDCLVIPRQIKDEIVGKCRQLISNGDRFIYPDAKEFILKSKNNDLAVLSFGDAKFQKEKIIGSGLNNVFKKVIVTQQEKCLNQKVLGKTKLYVDNEITILEKIKNNFPGLKLYFIDRDNIDVTIPEGIQKITKLTEIKI